MVGERTEGIIASNQLAHDYKMTVMLKPHLLNHNFYTGDLDFQLMSSGKMGSRL
jgi:hypothetical protein